MDVACGLALVRWPLIPTVLAEESAICLSSFSVFLWQEMTGPSSSLWKARFEDWVRKLACAVVHMNGVCGLAATVD